MAPGTTALSNGTGSPMATRRRREDDDLFGPPAQEDISDNADTDALPDGAAAPGEAEETDSDLGLGEMGADSAPVSEEPPAEVVAPTPAEERPDALSEFGIDVPAEPLFADEPAEEEPGARESFWTRLAN